MADRYAVATGNWNDTATWSATDGGAAGASFPVAGDNVKLTATSGAITLTVNVSSACGDLTCTGFTGTLAGSAALAVGGSATIVAGMTFTYSGAITFNATATGKTVTVGGKSFTGIITFNGVGGGWTMQDTWSSTGTSGHIVLTNGTLDTNGVTVTCYRFDISGTSTRTCTLGASVINVTDTWSAATTTNLTFNVNTSSIRLTGSGNFAGGALTYNDVQIANTANNISGANTFATLTRTGTAAKTNTWTFAANQTITGTLTINGNSTTNRMMVSSDTHGTARTLTAATVVVTNSDFQDITGAGAGSWDLSAITGKSGNCGGNTNITFTTAADQYWFSNTGSVSDSTKWFLATNGGGGAGRVPLPQDTARIDANSITSASQTITQDMPRIGSFIFTGVTNTPTFTTNTVCSLFGSLTLVSGMSLTGSNQAYTYEGRSASTLTTAGKTWVKNWTIDCDGGGSLTLQDAFTSNGSIIITSGSFDTNDQAVSASALSSSNSNTRTITIDNSTLSFSGTGAPWNLATTTNLTLSATGSTIKFTSASASSKLFAGGGKTYGNLWFAVGAGTGVLQMSGSNTFDDIKDDGTAAHTLQITAGTTISFTTLTGFANNLVALGSTTAANHNLVKIGGGTISVAFASIARSQASPANTFYTGTATTDNGNNSGWIFTDPPGGGSLLLMGVGS